MESFCIRVTLRVLFSTVKGDHKGPLAIRTRFLSRAPIRVTS